MDRDGKVNQSELGISLDRQSQLEEIWGKDGFAIAYERGEAGGRRNRRAGINV